MLQCTKSTAFIFRAEISNGVDPYVQELEQMGITSVVIPIMDFKYLNMPVLQKYLEDADAFCGIIFTSTRSVKAVEQAVRDMPEKCVIKKWQRKMNFCVGEATKSMAKSVLHLEIFGESERAGNSENLAEIIVNTFPRSKKAFLFPCSSNRRESLLNILPVNGISIQEICCYDSIASPKLKERLEELISSIGSPEILVFFSPSGVHFVHDVFQMLHLDLSKFKVAAIGPSTSKELSKLGTEPWAVAAQPTPRELGIAMKTRLENQQ